MANVAAHLVDRVLPAVPVRQWVLSLPFELRALAAFRADVLAALVRIFVEAVDRRHREWAKRVGLGDAPTGAVTHVQRFGSSVNLNVHSSTSAPSLAHRRFPQNVSDGLRASLTAPLPYAEHSEKGGPVIQTTNHTSLRKRLKP
jgi:hypothetical protein